MNKFKLWLIKTLIGSEFKLVGKDFRVYHKDQSVIRNVGIYEGGILLLNAHANIGGNIIKYDNSEGIKAINSCLYFEDDEQDMSEKLDIELPKVYLETYDSKPKRKRK